ATEHAAHLAAKHAAQRTHAALADLFHHIGHLAVLLGKLVDFGHFDARAGSDALAAAGIEQVRIDPFLLGHGIDDGDLPVEHFLIDIGARHGLLELARAGQHAHQPAHATHLLHLDELTPQVLEIERTLLELF